MYSLFLKIFDIVFPPRHTEMCVRRIVWGETSSLYVHQVIDTTHVLSSYTHPHIRALIHEAKFHGNKKAFSLLNTLFQQFLTEYTRNIDVIIPIPLSASRMRTRGYNQVREILCAGNTSDIIPLETQVLKRTRNTRPQTELSRNERLENMHDAFGVVHEERIVGKHILLVDDVTTTGTTLMAAKATLLRYHPASVTLLALAH